MCILGENLFLPNVAWADEIIEKWVNNNWKAYGSGLKSVFARVIIINSN